MANLDMCFKANTPRSPIIFIFENKENRNTGWKGGDLVYHHEYQVLYALFPDSLEGTVSQLKKPI